MGESVGERYGGRPPEVVALSALPSLGTQDVGLHLRFDPLRDTGQVHAVDQPAHTLSKGVGLAVTGGEVLDESQVELDPGHRQVPQHRDGRVAGTEVVDVDADTEPAQGR